MPIVKILVSLFLLFPFVSRSQTKDTYCELIAQGKLFSRKVSLADDFAQKSSFWKGLDVIKDEMSGKAKKFNSVVGYPKLYGLGRVEIV
ncbi:hypothetical protein PV783_24775 [Chitinophaga sp. CC14]|uniref:hypothetical protein n=1 Tax=Chitinophaga sp. CC14 TaxID=3029199 RepID=UPI003B764258